MKKARMDLEQKNYSDDTARQIDSAVKALLQSQA